MTGKEGRETVPKSFMFKFPEVTSIVIPLYKLKWRLKEVRDSSMFTYHQGSTIHF